MNTAQLSHIKKSVLGSEAFDSFISAGIPEGPPGAAASILLLCFGDRKAGLSWPPYEVRRFETSEGPQITVALHIAQIKSNMNIDSAVM